MKKAIKMILGALLGVVVGHASFFAVIYMVDGKEAIGTLSKIPTNIPLLELIVPIAVAGMIMYVAVVLHIILHETGHMLGGLATGYRFFSIRFFKYTIVKTDSGLRLRRYSLAGTGGQCVMCIDPRKNTTDNVPYFWYNAGGVLMNIVLATASIAVLHFDATGMYGEMFFLAMSFCGVVFALLNGIPLNVGMGVNNDGRNILELHRNPRNRTIFMRSFQVVGEMGRGTRPKDMPDEWFSENLTDGADCYFTTMQHMSIAARLEDQGHFDEARTVYENLHTTLKKPAQLFSLEISGEHAMTELLTLGRTEVMKRIWTKQAEKYTRQNSRFSPVKLATLYAVELLYNHNTEKAQAIYDELHRRKDDFYLPGETATALFLAEHIKKTINN